MLPTLYIFVQGTAQRDKEHHWKIRNSPKRQRTPFIYHEWHNKTKNSMETQGTVQRYKEHHWKTKFIIKRSCTDDEQHTKDMEHHGVTRKSTSRQGYTSGISEWWNDRMMKKKQWWNDGMMEWWNDGIMGIWDDGMMELGNDGMIERNNDGMME